MVIVFHVNRRTIFHFNIQPVKFILTIKVLSILNIADALYYKTLFTTHFAAKSSKPVRN